MRLPWAEHARTSRNMFVQREQIVFVTNNLLRNLSPETEGMAEFSLSFARLSIELLEGTLKEQDAAEGGEQVTSTSQKQKMRREVLRFVGLAES